MDEAYAIILLGDKLKDSNSFIRTKNEMPTELALQRHFYSVFPGWIKPEAGLCYFSLSSHLHM